MWQQGSPRAPSEARPLPQLAVAWEGFSDSIDSLEFRSIFKNSMMIITIIIIIIIIIILIISIITMVTAMMVATVT